MFAKLILLSAALVTNPPASDPDETPAAPKHAFFSYHGDELSLSVPTEIEQTVVVRYREVDLLGNTSGVRQKLFAVKPGNSKVSFPVAEVPGHRVTLSIGGKRHTIWANRGNWFSAMHKDLRVETTLQPRGFDSGLDRPDDVLLARGMRAYVLRQSGSRKLSMGRLFGFEEGIGVTVEPEWSLAVAAKGTVGPVLLTMARRTKAGGAMQYWDYQLVLGEDYRRFEVPLSAFVKRPGAAGPSTLNELHSLTIRALRPTKADDVVEIDFLALSSRTVRITEVARKGGELVVGFSGKAPPGSTLYLDDPDGGPDDVHIRAVDHKRRVRLDPTGATRMWLCQERAGVEVCDPPDAPSTTYKLPRKRGEHLVIDAFDSEVAVNAKRMPTLVFGSSRAVEDDMTVSRSFRGMTMGFTPTATGEYVGYLTRLPPGMSSELRSIEIKLKTDTSPSNVVVSVKDEAGHEPRIPLATYVTQTYSGWQRIRIPLTAFDSTLAQHDGAPPLSDLRQVAVTMRGQTPGTPQTLSLQEVRMSPHLPPLVVARFDDEPEKRNALGGIIHTEAQRGGIIELGRGEGHRGGQSLKVDAAVRGPRGYAVFDLGRLDTTGYERVCLRSRGVHGGEDLTVHLRSGQRRFVPAQLSHYGAIGKEWSKVCIPIGGFGTKVRWRPITHLALAWEDRLVAGETVYLDDITFE